MTVEFTVDEHVARVTIMRADRMNAVDEATADRLEEIWSEIEANRDVRVIVITGDGEKAFCAGADLKAAANKKSGLEYWAHARANGFGGLAMRSSLLVPVIARVNGLALGGGFEMVMGCDIVVAAEHASFGLPEAKVGLMPLDGGMIMLPRLVPEKLAMGMLMTGKRISAAEARSYGLVNDVVPAAELDNTVNVWVEQIKECAPLSVKAIKECVKQTRDLPVSEAQSLKLPALLAALESDDANEGPRAFREKRKPEWQGR
ncbi:MAG: enoyl-CoA hydratase/isomerase family protein [Gammaproteobacteria bacterium]|nr:enoyl-CoA hydratase/isomerase family protein [Gammaproteobacteria bacterium]